MLLFQFDVQIKKYLSKYSNDSYREEIIDAAYWILVFLFIIYLGSLCR